MCVRDGDVRQREDEEWLEAAASYLALRAQCDGLAAHFEQAKAHLSALASHPKEQDGGVAVTKFWRRGNIDYKRVPELAGVDLEPYRGGGREEVRITAA